MPVSLVPFGSAFSAFLLFNGTVTDDDGTVECPCFSGIQSTPFQGKGCIGIAITVSAVFGMEGCRGRTRLAIRYSNLIFFQSVFCKLRDIPLAHQFGIISHGMSIPIVTAVTRITIGGGILFLQFLQTVERVTVGQ